MIFGGVAVDAEEAEAAHVHVVLVRRMVERGVEVAVLHRLAAAAVGVALAAGAIGLLAHRLAKAAGRPVQVMWSREEEFFYDAYRPAAIVKIDSGIDAAGKIIAGVSGTAKDKVRVEALQARLALATASLGLDATALAAQVAKNPADLAARLQLAHALASHQDYRAAFEHLLEIVRRDRKFQDDIGRKSMLTLFSLLGSQPQYDDLVREFRVALGRTLN